MPFTKVAKTSDVAEGHGKCVDVGGKKIALFNIGGSFYAIDETCPHKGGPLSEGAISGDDVTCPWHGAVFNVTTGAHVKGPGTNVNKYAVQVVGDDVEVDA
ncbi:MAG: non-heme iron oxygenase ferredoxin subunit [Candidatus Obscuribacterales bacterium]|nr:non-heme iron oxygenase ferredoxin subunit [Candidatus Obscuribacterales bacterium]